MIVRAKFNSTCITCLLPIDIGDHISWSPGYKAECLPCSKKRQPPEILEFLPLPKGWRRRL